MLELFFSVINPREKKLKACFTFADSTRYTSEADLKIITLNTVELFFFFSFNVTTKERQSQVSSNKFETKIMWKKYTHWKLLCLFSNIISHLYICSTCCSFGVFFYIFREIFSVCCVRCFVGRYSTEIAWLLYEVKIRDGDGLEKRGGRVKHWAQRETLNFLILSYVSTGCCWLIAMFWCW